MSKAVQDFYIGPNEVCFRANAYDLAILAQTLSKLELEKLPDLERVCFELWLSGLKSAVKAALGMAWLDEQGLSEVKQDIEEYLL